MPLSSPLLGVARRCGSWEESGSEQVCTRTCVYGKGENGLGGSLAPLSALLRSHQAYAWPTSRAPLSLRRARPARSQSLKVPRATSAGRQSLHEVPLPHLEAPAVEAHVSRLVADVRVTGEAAERARVRLAQVSPTAGDAGEFRPRSKSFGGRSTRSAGPHLAPLRHRPASREPLSHVSPPRGAGRAQGPVQAAPAASGQPETATGRGLLEAIARLTAVEARIVPGAPFDELER